MRGGGGGAGGGVGVSELHRRVFVMGYFICIICKCPLVVMH